MNLNTDISQLFKKKKVLYPTKKEMNLYYKVDKTTAPVTAILYILFVVVLLLGISKVLIYDKIMYVNNLMEVSQNLDNQIVEDTAYLTEYTATLEAYTRYSPTKQELELVNRLEILNLIDEKIRSSSKISEISIEGNQVLVSFTNVTLDETAQIVASLEQSPIVKKTSVDTAYSLQDNKNVVDVSILIDVSKGGAH